MNNHKLITAFLPATGLLALILDSRTGFLAAKDGVTLCIATLIPSMFPFFILSMLLTNALSGQSIWILRPVARLCGVPVGSESLLAIGILGGYPVGARNVIFSCHKGIISLKDAQRMAVFCNFAGPAFLFGYLGTIFDNPIYPWIIWGIHITSALFLGWIMPGGTWKTSGTSLCDSLSLPQALHQSILVMGQVCGWVVLFRVLIGFLDRWLFWAIPDTLGILFTGILELSNGCTMLCDLESDGFRFVLASTILGFGGICVLMQTCSIAGDVKLPMYLPGKAFQGCISFLLSYVVQFFLPGSNPVSVSSAILISVVLCAIFLMLFLRKQEKPVAIFRNLLYNQTSCKKRRTICSSEKKSKNPAPIALSARG